MKQRTRRRLQNICVIILIALCLGWVAYRFWGFTSSTFTDNARIEQLIVPVNSRVQGFVTRVCFDDYTRVSKGDTLVVIDDAEYTLRLAQARADLQNVTTGKEALNTSISTTLNNVTVNEAQIAEAKVRLEHARRDLERYTELLDKGAVTRQQYDAVKTNCDALEATYTMLTRQRNSTSMGSQEQKVRLGQNDAAIEMAQAALRLAELNLSYTVITAPCDGYCARRDVQVGQLIQPGQTVAYVVDADDIWVTANYREKQVGRMAVGDSVKITVDAIPGISFKGYISDISAATGEHYTGASQSHAVGNFVKVEQRIPVKIRFAKDNSPKEMARLRAGMNVECKVVD